MLGTIPPASHTLIILSDQQEMLTPEKSKRNNKNNSNMKKNVALAMIAFVFAVGSAVASKMMVSEHVWVHAQFGNLSSPVVCIDTGVSCTQSTTGICTVRVNLATTPPTQGVASTTGANKTYREGCTEILGNPSDIDQTSEISGDDRPMRLVP